MEATHKGCLAVPSLATTSSSCPSESDRIGKHVRGVDAWAIVLVAVMAVACGVANDLIL